MPYQEMVQHISDARIVITHGGPASFIMPLQIGKIPVVVPRQKKFNEHVNNHQLEFCNEVEKRQKNIIVVSDIGKLGQVIEKYNIIAENLLNTSVSNNENFNKEFKKIVEELFK